MAAYILSMGLSLAKAMGAEVASAQLAVSALTLPS